MKLLTVIDAEFKHIRKIPAWHFALSVVGAALVTFITVMRISWDTKALSVVNWLIIFFVPLLALFLFYASVRVNGSSVLRFTKLIFYICTPFILMFLTGVFFGPNRATMYAENFFGRFLPLWIMIWWLGTLLLVIIMRLFVSAVENGYEKGSFMARVFYALAAMYTPQKTITRQKRNEKRKWIVPLACMLMVALAVFTCTVTLFLYMVYSNMRFEAILFTITFASGGLAFEDVMAGFMLVVLFLIVAGYLGYHLFKCFLFDRIVVADTNDEGQYTLVLDRRKRAIHIVMSAVFLLASMAWFTHQTEFLHYISVKSSNSVIYDSHYVSPDETVITFPEKKRNLIYIFLESMENTYASKEEGGSQERNYISGLTELIKESSSVNFSNTEKIGGASVFVPAISHTMGSTVAQTSGIAMNTTIFESDTKEFPPVRRLEDVLHDNGYNQLYIEGSKGEFSLYDKYVGRYEDSKVYDRISLVEQGYAKENADYMWKWGIEDQKLIEITKELITEMSQKDKPFFVTMYTMDTHTFETGHRCKNCDENIINDYLAAVECSSRSVCELVEWIKQQSFYENTTIVLVGDHLGNKKTAMVDIDDDYVRTTYNCIINPVNTPINSKNRVFSSLDMLPTTLSAIGVEIKGDRLGLGTDLFSSTPTLCEELGVEKYQQELERNNDY